MEVEVIDPFEQTPEIRRLIHEKDWHALSKRVNHWPEAEIASVMSDLPTDDRVIFFRLLHRKIAADVFSHLDPEEQQTLLDGLAREETAHLLDNLTPDDRTALLEELPASVLQQMFAIMSPRNLETARALLGYPEDSVGRLMTPRFIKVKPQWTISQALEHIRKNGADGETFNIIYVVDDEGKLIDDVKLRRFIMADPEAKVESIMDDQFVSLSAFDDQEEAVRKIRRYDLYALPVVDSDGVLIGIVTVDDMLDVAEEEATEDLQKIAAVAPLDISYRHAPFHYLFRKRIGWLMVLAGVGLLAGGVIDMYEDAIQKFAVLAAFIPLLIGGGGNTGAQSATLMVRSLSTKDLEMSQFLFAMRKELFVGTSLAIAMGLLCFVMGLLLSRGDFAVAVVIGFSMAAIVIVANYLGTILPFILSKIKLDPAVASSPLIASVMDCTGLLIFFNIARMVLDFSPPEG